MASALLNALRPGDEKKGREEQKDSNDNLEKAESAESERDRTEDVKEDRGRVHTSIAIVERE